MFEFFTEIFNWLPLAHCINEKILVRSVCVCVCVCACVCACVCVHVFVYVFVSVSMSVSVCVSLFIFVCLSLCKCVCVLEGLCVYYLHASIHVYMCMIVYFDSSFLRRLVKSYAFMVWERFIHSGYFAFSF